MPPSRPGLMKYVVATKACVHGQIVVEDNLVGQAVKQRAPAWDSTPASHDDIAITEPFALISKGIVEAPTIGGAVKGSTVSDHRVEQRARTHRPRRRSGRKVGRVVELAGERGGRSTHIRIDLDAKDSF